MLVFANTDTEIIYGTATHPLGAQQKRGSYSDHLTLPYVKKSDVFPKYTKFELNVLDFMLRNIRDINSDVSKFVNSCDIRAVVLES